MQIVSELNGKEIKSQDKDIEIERLQTTCLTLNNKCSIVDDLMGENEVLKKRLSESENIRALQKDEIAEYERRRIATEAEYERNRQEYERRRVASEAESERRRVASEAEYERNRV